MAFLYRVLFLFLVGCLILPGNSRAEFAVSGGMTHERESGPGEVYNGVITLRNNGAEPQEIKVYQRDYLFYADGKNIYGESGTAPRSNAGWIRFSPERLTVPAHGQSDISFQVSVPHDATLTGTYWSMLMVEGIATASETPTNDEKTSSMGITHVMRYGYQVISHMGNSGIRQLKFINTKLTNENGRRILLIDVENTGERLQRPALWAELCDEKGGVIGRFEGGKYRVYPATSVRYTFDLTEVPFGVYKALVVADSGEDDLFGVTYTFRFEP